MTRGAGVVQTVPPGSSTASRLDDPTSSFVSANMEFEGLIHTETDTSSFWKRRDMEGLDELAWPLDAYDSSTGMYVLGDEAPLATYDELHNLEKRIPESSTPSPAQPRFLCLEDLVAYHGLSSRPLREVFLTKEALAADALLQVASFIIDSKDVTTADASAIAEVDAMIANLGDTIFELHLRVYGTYISWY
ncbi:hypothetical protein GGF50DRAFT_130412 [Schizophyllum commune]